MMNIKNKNINRGAAILTIIFALLFFALTVRFFQIQVTGKADGQVLAAKAEQLYTKKRTIEAHRGEILDRNGEVIAQDTSAYTLVAILDETLTVNKKDPQHVVDPQETAMKLAPILDMSVSELERILTKDKKQVEFGEKGRNLSYATKEKIEKLHLPGIAFIRDSKRYYPNGMFASHVIGYAQKKISEDKKEMMTVGMMGIEKEYDKYLREKDGYVLFESDTKGFVLPNGKEKIVPPDNGDNIYLTIDQKIQSFLEDAMNHVQKEYEPKEMIAIVSNPKTGQILAMSSRPSFDPNKKDITNYLNPAISYRFEPGSTMKLYPLAAAIEEGVFNENELYQSGQYSVEGGTIKDHNGVGWGKITFLEGVQRSSNVAFAIIANEKLGPEKFLEYLHRFNLHQPTGIDIPGEVTSEINYKWPLDKITTAFGQGTAITPIQQIQAASAIANDGKMMKPYIIDHIVDPDTKNTILQKEPEVVGTPISKETAKKVRDILETVVTSPNGTGKPYYIEGYDVAGKTGTAQIPDPDGGYMTGWENYIFSFIGMAPKDDPQLLMYVAVKQPKLDYTETGSAPVSEIFKPVMANSLQYLKIKPSKQDLEPKSTSTKKNIGIKLENYQNKDTKATVDLLQKMGLTPVVLGDGEKIIDQLPVDGVSVLPGGKVVLKTNGDVKYPDFTGWSLRDVLKVTTLLKLEPTFKGHGFVKSQNIKPGAPYNKNDQLQIQFESRVVKNTKQKGEDETKEESKEQEMETENHT